MWNTVYCVQHKQERNSHKYVWNTQQKIQNAKSHRTVIWATPAMKTQKLITKCTVCYKLWTALLSQSINKHIILSWNEYQAIKVCVINPSFKNLQICAQQKQKITTKIIQQSLSWETTSHSAGKKIMDLYRITGPHAKLDAYSNTNLFWWQ